MLEHQLDAHNLGIVILAAIGIEYLRVIFKGYSEISVAILMATGMAVAGVDELRVRETELQVSNSSCSDRSSR